MAKPRKPNALPNDGPTYHYPTPDEEGLRKVKELYREKKGIELADDEAYRVLAATMRWLFLLNTQPPEPGGGEGDGDGDGSAPEEG